MNAVSPAWVRTPMVNRAMEAVGATHGLDQDGAYEFVTSHVPLPGRGSPKRWPRSVYSWQQRTRRC